MNEQNNVSRRAFLQRISAMSALGVGAGTLLSACGGEKTSGEAAETQSAQTGGQCTDLTGLTEAEIQARQTLGYVDESPYPEKLCNNCQFWIVPEGGAYCGGCQILKGPVAPEGYCNSWAAQLT